MGRISMEPTQRSTSSHNTPGNELNTHVPLMTAKTWTPVMYPANMHRNTQTWIQSLRR